MCPVRKPGTKTPRPASTSSGTIRRAETTLNLKHDRYDHRPAAGLLLNEPFNIDSNLFLYNAPVHAFFMTCRPDRLLHDPLDLIHQSQRIFFMDKAACHNLRLGFDVAGRWIQRDDRDHDPVV